MLQIHRVKAIMRKKNLNEVDISLIFNAPSSLSSSPCYVHFLCWHSVHGPSCSKSDLIYDYSHPRGPHLTVICYFWLGFYNLMPFVTLITSQNLDFYHSLCTREKSSCLTSPIIKYEVIVICEGE